MIHAALDTSLAAAFAVHDGERLLANLSLASHGRDSDELLVPWLVQAVRDLNLDLATIRQWSVGTGPGSFSGTRVGISWVLGVAAVTGAAVRGVPSSLALAQAAPARPGDRIAVLHDARRGQLILSPYQLGPAGPTATDAAAVVTVAELLAADFAVAVTAQEPVAALVGDCLGQRLHCVPGIDASLLLATTGIPWPTSRAETIASLEPVYVRPAVFVKPRPVVDR